MRISKELVWDDTSPVDSCIRCKSWTDNRCDRCLKYICRKHRDKCLARWDAFDRVLPRIVES